MGNEPVDKSRTPGSVVEGVKRPELQEDLVPQMQVEPPDFFRSGDTGIENREVESVVAVGDWKVGVAGGVVVAVDGFGNMIGVPEELKPPVLSLNFVLKKIEKEQGNVAIFDSKEGSNPRYIYLYKYLMESIPGLTDVQAEAAKNQFFVILAGNGVIKQEYENANYVQLNAAMSVVNKLPLWSISGKSLKVNKGGDNSVVLTNSDGESRQITVGGSLTEWTSKIIDKGVTSEESMVGSMEEMGSGLRLIKIIGEKARLVDGNGKQAKVLPGEEASVDPEDKKTVWYVEGGKVISLDTGKLARGVYEPVEAKLPEGVEGCSQVYPDPNGNFLVLVHSEKITVAVKNTMQSIDTIEGVGGSVMVGRDGNITYVDKNKQLRQINTNFSYFPTGFGVVVAERQSQKAKALAEATANLVMPDVDIGAAIEESVNGKGRRKADAVEMAMEGLNQKLNGMFSPLINEAKTEAEVTVLRLQLRAITEKSEFAQYPVASEGIERALDVQMAKIQAERLGNGLVSMGNQLGMVQSLEGSLALTSELKKLQTLRGEVNLMLLDPEQSKALQQRLTEIGVRVGALNQRYQGELVVQLQQVGTEELAAVLGPAQTLAELEEAQRDPAVKAFMERVNLIADPKQRAEMRRIYGVALEKRQAEIEMRAKDRDQERKTRAGELAEEIEEGYVRLSKRVEGILKESHGTINLAAWGQSSTTVEELKQQIGHLPEEYQQQYMARIQEILAKQKAEYQTGRVEKKEVKTHGATVRFGKESFPVYQPPLVNVTSAWIPVTHGMDTKNDVGEVVFRSSRGEVWRTGTTMKMNMDEKRRVDQLERLRQAAEAKFSLERKVPKLPTQLVLTPYQEQVLEKMTKYFRQQLGMDQNLVKTSEPQGILIIQGDAGAGKDFDLDVWAAMAGYEHEKIPCSFAMDPTDLTSEFRFDPKKGTYRVPSKFVQAIQRPGVMINLVEINTLPPGLTKMLNTVFDYQRTLYITQGEDVGSFEISENPIKNSRQVRVAEGTVFVGTMNYANYQGTRPLSQEFLSRSRVMDVDYPPYRVAKNGDGTEERLRVEQTSVSGGMSEMKIRPDEAMILARQMESLRSLTTEEFGRLWDHIVNKQAGNGADVLDKPERRKAIEQLNQVVAVANKMRQAYRAFQANESGAPVFEFVFSIRECQDIVKELAEGGATKTAIAEVVLPKIADPTQRKQAQAIISTA